MTSAGSGRGELRYFDRQPRTADMREEILEGLSERPRRLPPKYFYDETGSRLFEQITRLPEYYLTRTEMALFDAHLDDIAGALGADVCLVEYGSGTSEKIRKLLERLRPAAYVPVDISGEHLLDQARALHQDYPWLNVYPTCADFTARFALPEPVAALPRVGFFPGSSIGNFDPAGAVALLGHVHATLGPGGRLLVGVDRKAGARKDAAVLEAAYNDSQGVTAAFNLNVLHHINARLDADFDPAAFAHEARYDPDLGCIQMFLRSLAEQTVQIGSAQLTFAAGEIIHTENSHKYQPAEFQALARRGGFEVDQWWTDEAEYFALYLLRAR
ncbi:MAG: L-histidine N(alpha)-methyltransferase [Gammaproteobacteria bacterium]|nr:L-histidine N(alpha)-methyltransferase [Gammaproteobacteria bacterium]